MKQLSNMKQQSGFTLIELVMVIVILGILAATALPKFVNLGADARVSAIKSVENSMRAANSMIYAKAAVAVPNALGATGTVSIAGQSITTQFGFAVDPNELQKAMDINTTDYAISTTDIRHNGAVTPANCSVTYTAATDINTPPVYTLDTSGC